MADWATSPGRDGSPRPRRAGLDPAEVELPRTATLDRPAPGTATPAEGTPTGSARARVLEVLVVSADALERQELALELSADEGLAPSSASGFHMAVPALWETRPDVVVIGTLAATDATRLDELAFHAGEAELLLLPTAPRGGTAVARARRLAAGEPLLTALRALAAR